MVGVRARRGPTPLIETSCEWPGRKLATVAESASGIGGGTARNASASLQYRGRSQPLDRTVDVIANGLLQGWPDRLLPRRLVREP
jgi:hypothetical protein